ncbi:MAG TPA: hypothetical protein VFW22_07910 [Pseudolabrys sp.]|nr:hypothetical protein [Pseudolabrys sp.]
MADDPLAGYTPPSQSAADPLAGYKPPVSQSWTDYLLGHLAGAPKTADDFVRAATDAMTFGYGDKAIGYLTGQNESALTQAARGRLGTAGNIAADVTGYAMGPGELNIAGRLGGGIIGSAIEGAGAGAASAAGHDQNPVGGAVTGGLTGGGGGALAKIASPVVKGVANKLGYGPPSAGDITDNLATAKTAAYDQLKNVIYSGDPVLTAAQNARVAIETADPGGALRQNAPRTMAELSRIENRTWPIGFNRATQQPIYPAQTAHDVLTSLDNLRDYQGPSAGAENDLAPIVEQHLNGVLASTPLAGSPGNGADLLAKAKAANALFKNAENLQEWKRVASIPGQQSVGSAAGAELKANPQFYDQGQSDALKSLAATGDKGASPYGTFRHVMHPLIEGAIHGGGLLGAGEITGHMPEFATMAALYGGAIPIYKAIQAARGAGNVQGALEGAYPALTGYDIRNQAPDAFNRAFRNLVFGGMGY